MEIGYACINMTLASQKPKITVNRGMIKRTFQSKGISYASELIIENLKDLIKIIKWNYDNGINVYRMSSDMFPWMSEYKFEDLPNFNTIKKLLKEAGDLSYEHNQRLSFHPGPFNVLASPNPDVVDKTIKELDRHSEIMDYMGLSTTPYNKINIHVGGVYGDKKSALERWVDSFDRLSENTKKRLTIENDDKISSYSVKDLMFIHEKVGIPIVFDFHHHTCHPDSMTHKEALEMALGTWGDIQPMTHMSESRDDKNIRAHSDYIRNKIETYGNEFDIVFEAKAKELAIFEYKSTF